MSTEDEADLQAAADAAICSLLLSNELEEDILDTPVFDNSDISRHSDQPIIPNRSGPRIDAPDHARLTHQLSDSSLVMNSSGTELRDEDIHDPAAIAGRSEIDEEYSSTPSEAVHSKAASKSAELCVEGDFQKQVLDLVAVMDRCGGDLELLNDVMDR